jgi:adenosine/AMP kinase
MKHFITFIFCLAFSIAFAQNKGINLIKNTSNHTTFIKENRRIKVKTLDGKSVAGKFTIVNDAEINIKGRIISMDSIVSIRKASTFSAIASPISIVVGGALLVGGMAGLAAGGYGLLLTAAFLPPGLPLFIVPFTANKHPLKKWTYEIVNK